MKLTCAVISTKKTSGTADNEFGQISKIQKQNHPTSFAEIEKATIEARI